MTGTIQDDLEQRLAALTAWPGGRTNLWQRALALTRVPRRVWRLPRGRKLLWLIPASVAAVALLATTLSIFPGLSTERWARGRDRARAQYGYQLAGGPPADERAVLRPPITVGSQSSARRAVVVEAGKPYESFALADQPPAQSSDTTGPAALDRQVVRKATIELKTSDVRAVFLKTAMVINEAQGEYVEGSAITGSGATANAHLTLRVAADRLDAVLNQLRSLGEVRCEEMGTEDVTAQVVDVEARLRNEQRVETELLQLLEKRQDAPLREVLELRDKIAGVREGIEKLVAQRDRLSRLVSLATVLVLIRAGDAPAPQHASLWGYFTRECAAAWNKGMTVLADTVATLLAVLVGGLFWWVLLVIVILAVRHWRRRPAVQAAKTPPERSA